MNLILLARDELGADGTITVADARAIHLRRVLNVEPGRTVRVGVIDGPLGDGTVLSTGEGAVGLRCRFDDSPPPRPRVDLLLAVPRPKVLRRLWAQLAALGVGHIVLTNAARVERNYFDTHILDEPVYRPLLIEGLQQARDTHVPRVSVHRQFRKLVEDELDTISDTPTRLVAHPGADASPADVVRAGGGERVLLAVGPEGGWNAFEIDLLRAHRCAPVSLGERTLRTDTACVALLSLVNEGLRATAS